MRLISALLLVYIFLFTNSCNHSKITLGRKHDFKRSEQTSDQQKDRELEQVQSDDVELTLVEEPAEIEEKKTLEDRAVEQLDELLDDESSETFHKIVEKTKSKKVLNPSPEKASKKQQDDRSSSTLVIFGIILLLLCAALVLYSINKVLTNDGSAEGCATSIIAGMMMIVLASIIGIIGLVVIIVGIVVFTKR